MLSIIICSRDAHALATVSQNVQDTIGVPYEIIAINNSTRRYGICEAYNIGAAQASYDQLCFMHEDIRVHTTGWGSIVTEILRNPEAGVIGVAGGTYQPKAPAGWAGGLYNAINVLHRSKEQPGKIELLYSNPWNQPLMKAASLDGLWLTCRKAVWKEFKFDEHAFSGFHFYDIDFCTRVASKYTNYVTFKILIEHFSHGTFDKIWMQSAIRFYKIRKNILPVKTFFMSKTHEDSTNLLAMQVFTTEIIKAKLPTADIVFCLKECLKQAPFNRDNLYLVKEFLVDKSKRIN